MADTVVLKLRFDTMAGEKTWNIKNANPNVTSSRVRDLIDTMITNGTIYKYPPLSIISAEKVVTTSTEFDLS